MSIVKGQGGVIHIGAVAVGHVMSWELENTVEPVDTTAMGDTAKSYIGGLTDGTFSCTVQWDASDVGQEDIDDGITAGTAVVVNLYPSGSTSAGADYYTGSVLITSNKVSGSQGDGLVERSVSGNGAMVLGTVAS